MKICEMVSEFHQAFLKRIKLGIILQHLDSNNSKKKISEK